MSGVNSSMNNEVSPTNMSNISTMANTPMNQKRTGSDDDLMNNGSLKRQKTFDSNAQNSVDWTQALFGDNTSGNNMNNMNMNNNSNSSSSDSSWLFDMLNGAGNNGGNNGGY